jgi:aspartyl protease family protein
MGFPHLSAGRAAVILRLAFFVVLAVLAAVLVPRLAPDFLAGMAKHDEPPPAPDVSAPLPALAREVRLAPDGLGHFNAEARINGSAVEVIVDTGASLVAINSDTARRLGIAPAQSAYTGRARTANGVVAVAPVTLSEIRLGEIILHDVEASVIPSEALDTNLLGMSFLRRLSGFRVDRGELILTQ